MNQEQTQPSQPNTDNGEDGSLDAAALAFEQREPQQGDQTQDEPTEDTQATDPNAEAEKGQTDEDTPELEEVEIEGVTLSVPKDQAEQIRKATLRQADYSRKMNEVSQKEKQAQAAIQQAEILSKGAEKYAAAMAEVQLADLQIKAFEGIDWQKLRQENPAEYAAYAADLQTRRLLKSEAEAKAKAASDEVRQAEFQTLAKQRDEMIGVLSKSLKGWGDEMGTQLTQYAISNGVKQETLSRLVDPGLVIALHKAKQFDELQKAKQTLKAAPKDVPPVLKPGTPKPALKPADEAMAKLRKDKTLDAAAGAFLSRMR